MPALPVCCRRDVVPDKERRFFMYDAIIIGAGPAGISAALYAKRANLSVLVLYHGESQLGKAHKIDNYYGFVDGITGAELYAAGIEQAKKLGIEVVESEVTGIQFETEQSYSVETPGKAFSGKSVVIATGNKKLRPAVKGIKEFEGKGISYCAVCDGFFYRGKRVVVVGDKLYAFQEASHLAPIASSVVVLTDGKDTAEISALVDGAGPALAGKITVDGRKIAEITGGSSVGSVVFADGGSIPADGVFVALGSAGGADFAKKLGLALDGDSIKVDQKMATSARGIFSCGNVNGGLLQVCKAVYEGGVAGLSAVEYVRSLSK